MKKKTGQRHLDHKVVHSALLELGWEAHYQIADCLDEAMKTIGCLITPELSERERTLFARMHLRRAAFGGLPLIMLTERVSFALPAIGEVLENDDPGGDHAAVLHRVLHWYAEISPKRRHADRLIHARTWKPNKGKKGKAAGDTGMPATEVSSLGTNCQTDAPGRTLYQGCLVGSTEDRLGDWPFARLFLATKACTGCRLMDLCAIKSVQLRDGRLVFPADLTKGRKERAVPLPADLYASLDAFKGATWLWESYPAGLKAALQARGFPTHQLNP